MNEKNQIGFDIISALWPAVEMLKSDWLSLYCNYTWLAGACSGWYGRKRIQRSKAGYLKKTHRGCISEIFKNKSAMPVFNMNQIK